MNKIKNSEVASVFNHYPKTIKQQLMFIRQLILDTASEIDDVSKIEESLKWGEPSYLSNKGSAVRLGWKESQPDQYKVLFHCQSKLVDTFRELYRNKFNFEGNRAIVFDDGEVVPVKELKHCISMALTYHDRKHLPMLGA